MYQPTPSTIYLKDQRRSDPAGQLPPGKAKVTNWLPAPIDTVYLVTRLNNVDSSAFNTAFTARISPASSGAL